MWEFPSTSNKLKESNIMREDYSMTKTRHVVKAKDALIVYKLRWFCYWQQKKCSFQSLAEEYCPSPIAPDKMHHHWHMVLAPYVQLGIPNTCQVRRARKLAC